MTYIKYKQFSKAKESKRGDLYSLFAIFLVTLQENTYMETTGKKERTVIHLQMGDIHEYFGSIANIYAFHSAEELGITYGSLRNYGLTADKPYMNSKCTIRKGVLHQKAGGRGIKKANI